MVCLRISGLIKEKLRPGDGSIGKYVCWAILGQGYMREDVPNSRRSSRDIGAGPPPRRRKDQGTLRERGIGEGAMCLGRVTQQQGRDLWVREL